MPTDQVRGLEAHGPSPAKAHLGLCADGIGPPFSICRKGLRFRGNEDQTIGEALIMAIHLSHHDEIALITLDRPEAMNALSFGQLHDLNRILDAIAGDKSRALLVTGAGDRAFSAGADIKELMGRSLVEQRAGALLGQSVLAKLDQLSMPSVALINGYAFGGGLELALASTFRLAVPSAHPARREVRRGPPPCRAARTPPGGLGGAPPLSHKSHQAGFEGGGPATNTPPPPRGGGGVGGGGRMRVAPSDTLTRPRLTPRPPS